MYADRVVVVWLRSLRVAMATVFLITTFADGHQQRSLGFFDEVATSRTKVSDTTIVTHPLLKYNPGYLFLYMVSFIHFGLIWG